MENAQQEWVTITDREKKGRTRRLKGHFYTRTRTRRPELAASTGSTPIKGFITNTGSEATTVTATLTYQSLKSGVATISLAVYVEKNAKETRKAQNQYLQRQNSKTQLRTAGNSNSQASPVSSAAAAPKLSPSTSLASTNSASAKPWAARERGESSDSQIIVPEAEACIDGLVSPIAPSTSNDTSAAADCSVELPNAMTAAAGVASFEVKAKAEHEEENLVINDEEKRERWEEKKAEICAADESNKASTEEGAIGAKTKVETSEVIGSDIVESCKEESLSRIGDAAVEGKACEAKVVIESEGQKAVELTAGKTVEERVSTESLGNGLLEADVATDERNIMEPQTGSPGHSSSRGMNGATSQTTADIGGRNQVTEAEIEESQSDDDKKVNENNWKAEKITQILFEWRCLYYDRNNINHPELANEDWKSRTETGCKFYEGTRAFALQGSAALKTFVEIVCGEREEADMFVFADICSMLKEDESGKELQRSLVDVCQQIFDEALKPIVSPEGLSEDEASEYFLKVKKKMINHAFFVAQLYKRKFVAAKVLTGCIRLLLVNKGEPQLEALCGLLATAGFFLSNSEYEKELNQRMKQIEEMVVADSTLSMRIKGLLQDVVDDWKLQWCNVGIVNPFKTKFINKLLQKQETKSSKFNSHK